MGSLYSGWTGGYQLSGGTVAGRSGRGLGIDGEGARVAFDELEINAAGERFAVKLLEPQPGVSYQHSLLARSRVEPNRTEPNRAVPLR